MENLPNFYSKWDLGLFKKIDSAKIADFLYVHTLNKKKKKKKKKWSWYVHLFDFKMFSHLEFFEEPNSDQISKLTMTSKNCEKCLKYHRPIQLFSIFLPLENNITAARLELEVRV